MGFCFRILGFGLWALDLGFKVRVPGVTQVHPKNTLSAS